MTALWSVSIVTKKGDCIASYRYPMLIANGVLANGGAIAIDVRGRVAADGAITVVAEPWRHARGRLRPAGGQCRRRLLEDRARAPVHGPPSGAGS